MERLGRFKATFKLICLIVVIAGTGSCGISRKAQTLRVTQQIDTVKQEIIASGIKEKKLELDNKLSSYQKWLNNDSLLLISLKHDSAKITSAIKQKYISIIGVGDIMLGTDYPSKSYLPPGGDCSTGLKFVESILQSADLTIGNLEGVFGGDEKDAKRCKDTINCYTFRMPERFIGCFEQAGFDILGVANNHVGDFGESGRESTAKVLSQSHIHFAGFSSHPYTIVDTFGLKFGFMAVSPSGGTVNMNDYGLIRHYMDILKMSSDIIIVSFHAGAEGSKYEHVPRKREIFLGMDRGDIYEFSHMIVDLGADIVFGHGPHVTRAIELYNDRIIAYSLGNFSTYARFNLRGPNGYAPILKVYVDRKGKFISGEIIPIYQEGEGITMPDPHNRAITRLQYLSTKDFPESPLIIKDDGKLVKNE